MHAAGGNEEGEGNAGEEGFEGKEGEKERKESGERREWNGGGMEGNGWKTDMKWRGKGRCSPLVTVAGFIHNFLSEGKGMLQDFKAIICAEMYVAIFPQKYF